MNEIKKKEICSESVIYLIILLAVVIRFVPHMPNFGPITALAIFSAYHLGWKKSILITLAIRVVSDLYLGFFAWPLMLAVYASHLVGTLFGAWISNSVQLPSIRQAQDRLLKRGGDFSSSTFQKGRQGGVKTSLWLKVLGSSLGSSGIFFLVTNFAFLYSNYTHNFSGIVEAYVNGLPFLRGTLFGDLSYTFAFFGAYAFVKFLNENKVNSKLITHNS